MKWRQTFFVVAILALAALAVWGDYCAWCMAHPGVPRWLYFYH